MSFKHPGQRNDEKRGPFDHLAEYVSNFTGSPLFFGLVLLLGVAWGVAYATGASDALKHLLEGLMAFLSLLLLVILKNAERRAELAIHEKLDALVNDRLEARGEPDIDALAELRRAHQLHDEV